LSLFQGRRLRGTEVNSLNIRMVASSVF